MRFAILQLKDYFTVRKHAFCSCIASVVFRESALIERFHGFIKGWHIPRMNDDLKISGWALNSEYFCAILHELRSDTTYRTVVDKLVNVPEAADTRDTEAVKRIATAYLKLLFPTPLTGCPLVEEMNQMPKDRTYYRWQRSRAIRRKLGILNRIGGAALAQGWTRGNNGRLAKGKIHCSCWMCRTKSFDCLPHPDLKCEQNARQQLEELQESEDSK